MVFKSKAKPVVAPVIPPKAPAPVVPSSPKPVVAAPSVAPVVTQEVKGKIAKKAISLTYGQGSFVPQKILDQWKSMGLQMDWYFED